MMAMSICNDAASYKHCNEITSSKGVLTLDDKLIFMHFPKTAGTTVHNCLAKNFLPHEICPERFANISLWPEALIRKYRYFSCHARFLDFNFVPRPLKVISFFRNPIARAISCFEYFKSYTDDAINNHNLPEPRLVKYMGISEFYSENRFAQCGRFWNNYATWLAGYDVILSTCELRQRANEIVDRALQNLDKLAFVGCTEMLQESLDCLSQQFDIKNHYQGEYDNITHSNHLKRPDLFNKIEPLDIKEDTYDIIANSQSLDMRIYQCVLQKIFGQGQLKQRLMCVNGDQKICRVRVGRLETWVQNLKGGFILFGPYCRLLPGRYRVEFRFRHQNADCQSVQRSLGFADVIAEKGLVSLGSSEIISDVLSEGTTTKCIEFTVPRTLNDCEFRIYISIENSVEVEKTVTLVHL